MNQYDSPRVKFVLHDRNDVISTSTPPVSGNYESVQDRINFDLFN